MPDNRKKFSTGTLTHSGSHHLLAMSELLQERGYARVSDIARKLAVTRGSASIVMQSLRESGYVEQNDDHFYRFTEPGRKAVLGLIARHKVVERFLAEVLGLSAEFSHRESCRVENLIDAPTARRLLRLLDFWKQRGLAEAFPADQDDVCLICGGLDREECDICGMEGVDGTCSLKE